VVGGVPQDDFNGFAAVETAEVAEFLLGDDVLCCLAGRLQKGTGSFLRMWGGI